MHDQEREPMRLKILGAMKIDFSLQCSFISIHPRSQDPGGTEIFSEQPDLWKYRTKENKNKMLKNIPLGRVAKESDVATAVAFLAADTSEMITGTSLVVDGGWTAQ